jgi:hypothetical protein
VAALEFSLRQSRQGLHDRERQSRIRALGLGDRHRAQDSASADQELVLAGKMLNAPQQLRIGCAAELEQRERAVEIGHRQHVGGGLSGNQRIEHVRPLRNHRRKPRSAGHHLQQGAQRRGISGERREQVGADRELADQAIEAADQLAGMFADLRGSGEMRRELGQDRSRAGRAGRGEGAAVPVVPICRQAVVRRERRSGNAGRAGELRRPQHAGMYRRLLGRRRKTI